MHMSRQGLKSFAILVSGLGFLSSTGAESLQWNRAADSVSLKNGDSTVWALKIQNGDCKPCIHPLNTLDGFQLSDYRPDDHVWHTALWFCFKFINGVNYWEENPQSLLSDGRTEVIRYQIKTSDDFSAVIDMTLSYHEPGQPELISEKRRIAVSSPKSDGSYTMDWKLDFTARRKVVLGRTPRIGEPNGVGHGGYAGMSLRLNKQTLNWRFLDSKGRADSHGKNARWMAFSGNTPKGSAAVSLYDHPSNPRYPNSWFIVPGMPYFSPAFVFDRSMKLESGDHLKLFYRVKVQSHTPDTDEIESEFRAFSQIKPPPDTTSTIKAGRRFNLVELGKTIATNYACLECHSVDREFEPGKQGPSWFGLIGKSSPHRIVHEYGKPIQVQVDDAYVRRSILEPTANLAIRQHDPRKGSPFLPIMPPYPMLNALEIEGITAYMKTLNEPSNQGPLTVWRQKELKPIDFNDPNEITVGDQSRVFRIAMADVSTRAISVGLPGGYNYIFDPRSFSVKKVWQGGFINLAKERTGRGRGFNEISRIDHEPVEFQECLIPLGCKGPVDLSYKDYLNDRDWQMKRFQEDLANPVPFLDQAPDEDFQFLGYLRPKNNPPIFQFRINGVEYDQQLYVESDKVLKFHFKTRGADQPIRFQVREDLCQSVESTRGILHDGQLKISPADAQAFVVTVHLKSPPPSPISLTRLAIVSSPGKADHEAYGPMAAIDENEETYWDETNHQKEYILNIHLPFEKTMNTLTIKGWKHHDFAPRDFRILLDGQVVKSVQNARYTGNLLTVHFNPVTGREIQLRIDGYYGGSPTIRELKVFHQ